VRGCAQDRFHALARQALTPERRGAAAAGSSVPAITEAAPRAAPEMTPETTPDLAEPPQDLDAPSPVAALAPSLLPPTAEPEADQLLPSEPSSPPAPSKIARSAAVIDIARGERHWRWMTFALGAIAALLAIYVAVARFAPVLIPLGRQASPAVAVRTQPSAARFVAVLQHEPIAPAFLLTVDPQSRTLTVRTVSATAEAGHSYELWLILSKFPNPRSLGVVGGEQFAVRPLPPDFDLDTMRAASYAVSLEPAGGSPSGVPTGPILFTGKLVESVPAPAPATPRT